MKNYPKISIITPSYNQGNYIEETILSIINQNYPNLEYIIIDGGSTDNSIEIIKKYKKYLSYWISEKDNGQSDAINKGIQRSTGDLFNWINSDDYLEKGALFEIARLYNDNIDCKLFIGKLKVIGESSESIQPNINVKLLKKGSIRNLPARQQSTFFSLNYIKKSGGLNNVLHYCMDAELIFRFLCSTNSLKIATTEKILGCYRIQLDSKGSTKIWDFVDELNIIYKNIAKENKNKRAECFFDTLIKDRKKEKTFTLNTVDYNLNKSTVLLNYQICNWIDYYYLNKDYLTVKKYYSILDFSKLALGDKYYYKILFFKNTFKMKNYSTFKKYLKRKFKRAVLSIISPDNPYSKRLDGAIVVGENKNNLILGENVTFGGNVYLHSDATIEIGEGTMIAYNCTIHTSTHDYTEHPMWTKRIDRPVKIGKHVWIGTGAIILGGVVIEDYAVIAAGTVITKNVPKGAIICGNPAKIIKYRSPETYDKPPFINQPQEATIIKKGYLSTNYS